MITNTRPVIFLNGKFGRPVNINESDFDLKKHRPFLPGAPVPPPEKPSETQPAQASEPTFIESQDSAESIELKKKRGRPTKSQVPDLSEEDSLI